MAEQGPPQPLMSALFPAPPPFFKNFTPENIAKVEELKKAHTETARKSSPSSHSIPFSLPPELRSSALSFLIPPPPPSDGAYRLFGQPHNINPPIPALPAGTPLLYTSPPTPSTLLNLTRSMMANFFEFSHILVTNPDEYPQKWEDLAALFRNAERALNEYRPFLAREEIIRSLEEEVRRGKEEIEGVRAMKRKVDMVLEGIKEGVVKTEEEYDLTKKRKVTTRVEGTNKPMKNQSVMNEESSDEWAMWEVLHGI